MTWRHWLSFAVCSLAISLAPRPAAAQLAPTGGHYAAQASDGGGPNSSGGYGTSIPLDLPGAQHGLSVPVQIVYSGQGFGTAGLGWDVPLSYIRRDNTVAHRRPKLASDGSPQARERVSLMLGGRTLELVQSGTEWVARRDAPDLAVREQSDGTWVAYDGQGRTYLFTVADPALSGANLWLLTAITGTGGSRVQLDYSITSPTVGTITGIAIDLTRVSYNPSPTTANCYKNTVVLRYDTPAVTPWSVSVLGDRLLLRMHRLDGVDVTSKATCGDSEVVLRGYQLQYQADADTQQPRLRSVRVVGQAGTPENATPLPIAAYSYGTATSGGTLQYQRSPEAAAPGFQQPFTLNESQPIPVFGTPFSTYVGLLDMTGDGLPDMITSDFIDRPLTIFADWLHSASGQSLLDSVLTHGPFEVHSLTQTRYKQPPSADLVWRQAIDVNGDGRLDIIDAAEQVGHWVIYLNVPDLTKLSTARWVKRSYSTQALEGFLTARGLHVDPGRVPIARRWTAEESVTKNCWTWIPRNFEWTVTPCGTTRSQSTFTEWELGDINGDGYPDVVMNSSGVINVTTATPPPPDPPNNPSAPHHVTQTVRVTPTLAAANKIEAVFNLLGVRIDVDSQPFSSPVVLATNESCGIAQWSETDSTHQALKCGVVDVNGDGLADRVSGSVVRLGTGALGANGFFTPSAVLSLPGALAIQQNNMSVVCTMPGSGGTPINSSLTATLQDLTGDGLPDYVVLGNTGQWSVAIGTGIGFLPSMPINGGFALSSQDDTCAGLLSRTTTGLYDVDGDGKPDVVTADAFVNKLAGSSGVLGAPEAGRLVQVDNGFGAITNITYRSAKLLLDRNPSTRAITSIHQVPFPEVVVSSLQTTLPPGPQSQNRNGAPVQYAYSGAELVFDPVSDRFTFPGYRRRVALSVPLEDQNGTATITDSYEPANTADPYDLGTTSLTAAQRYARYLRLGKVSDVTMLSGNVGTDPVALLAVNVTTDARRIASTHNEWDARLLTAASNTPEACSEMVYPYDLAASLAFSTVDSCSQRGFAFAASVHSLRGEPGASASSAAIVTTRSEVRTIDDLGRVTSAKQLGDLARTDDDVCIDTVYADPTGANERVLSARSTQTVGDCGTAIYARETWQYDQLALGKVAAGLPNSHTVERRDETGALLGTVREFDVTFTAEGNPVTMSTKREDGAGRTVSVTYDPFALVPVIIATTAGSLPKLRTDLTRDPLTLNVTASRDPNGTKRGTVFDGLDRIVVTTVTPPGGTEGALSCTSYQGFDGSDSHGRSITTKVFTDPVAPATACTSAGRTGTVHLDELGRGSLTEQVLGASYPNITMKADRTYDSLGRVLFETDPYPSNQDAATAYGTTSYFNPDGRPLCVIRGKGKQQRPPTPQKLSDPPMATDEAGETYPTCFSHSFQDHTEVVSVRDASSLLSGSPQDGVIKSSSVTATGRLVARATTQGSNRLEYAIFTQDRLGHAASMTRYQNAASGTNPVTASWHTDSLGEVLELDDPDSPAQFNVYSDWGELVETRRTVNGSVKRVLQKYDALGRRIHSEQQTGGVVDPDTVHDYAYDTAVQVAPQVTATNVLGRLAQATWPTGSVTYSYDGLGRNNAQVFTDAQGGLYVEKHAFHGDGSPSALDLFLPDTAYADEHVDYAYDSAGRGYTVNYTNGANSQLLYHAATIDPFGRVRQAQYGAASYSARYDDVGRRLLKQVSVGSTLGVRSTLYSVFDPVGRERSRTEGRGDRDPGVKTGWTYDALGRLSSAVQTAGTTTNFNQQFSYDAVGNVLKTTSTGTSDTPNTTLTYSTTDRDKICRLGFGSDSGTACNVTYDELGSILSQPTPTGTRQYTYLADGSIRSITDDHGSVANFRYDAFGQVQELDLTTSTSADERQDRHYGGLVTIRKEKANGSSPQLVLTHKIPLHGGSFATRHGSGGPWAFDYGEHRGNRIFTDGTGAFVQDVDYQPFGKATSTGAQPGSQLYSNNQWNFGDSLAAFGISKLGARVYDPAMGRFISRDPLLITRGAATSNPYAFADNDPVNFSDPTGLQKKCKGPSCPQAEPDITVIVNPGGASGRGAGPEDTYVIDPEIPWEDRDPFANVDVSQASGHVKAAIARRTFHKWLDVWSAIHRYGQGALESLDGQLRRNHVHGDAWVADGIDRIRHGQIDALGADYANTYSALAFADAQLSVTSNMLNWIEAQVAMGRRPTIDQVTARGAEEARAQGIYTDIFMTALTAGYGSFRAWGNPLPPVALAPHGYGGAQAVASDALAASKTQGAASELIVGTMRFSGVSGEEVPMHSSMLGKLMGTPKGVRSDWHGGCAEIVCINKALNAGVDPWGGSIRTVNIGSSGTGHGTPKAPCSTCNFVLDLFGVGPR